MSNFFKWLRVGAVVLVLWSIAPVLLAIVFKWLWTCFNFGWNLW